MNLFVCKSRGPVTDTDFGPRSIMSTSSSAQGTPTTAKASSKHSSIFTASRTCASSVSKTFPSTPSTHQACPRTKGLRMVTPSGPIASHPASPSVITLSLKVLVGAGQIAAYRVGEAQAAQQEFPRWEILIGDRPLRGLGQASFTGRWAAILQQIAALDSYAAAGTAVVSPEARLAARLPSEDCPGLELISHPDDSVSIIKTPSRLAANSAAQTNLSKTGSSSIFGHSSVTQAAFVHNLLRQHCLPAVQTRLQAGLRDLRPQNDPRNITADDELGSVNFAAQTVASVMRAHLGCFLQFRCDEKGFVAIAAFGLPDSTHEHMAAHAVEASLDIVEGINEGILRNSYSVRSERSRRPVTPCKVGLTSGLTLCACIGGHTRFEYTIFGDVVNTAARLMCKAGVDGREPVLCDAATKGLAKRTARYRSLVPVHLKGHDEPLPLFAVSRRTHAPRLVPLNSVPETVTVAITNPPGAAQSLQQQASLALSEMTQFSEQCRSGPLGRAVTATVGNQGVLVGRASEAKEALERRLRQLAEQESGSGGCIIIEGPAGVGKSRLLAETGANSRICFPQNKRGTGSTTSSARSSPQRWVNDIIVLAGNPCSLATSAEKLWPWRRVFSELLGIDQASTPVNSRLATAYQSPVDVSHMTSISIMLLASIPCSPQVQATPLGDKMASLVLDWDVKWCPMLAELLGFRLDELPKGPAAVLVPQGNKHDSEHSSPPLYDGHLQPGLRSHRQVPLSIILIVNADGFST
eukprot:scaffold39039_cov38-Prasinocladus_malaysianus.AAC.2